MTLNERERRILTKLHVDKAHDTVVQVGSLIERGDLLLAVNRIYYGIYYALSALAIHKAFGTTKHRQLIGWFNREFVKAGLTDSHFGRIVRRAFENRTESDYDVMASFEPDEVSHSFREMQELIAEVERLIGGQPSGVDASAEER